MVELWAKVEVAFVIKQGAITNEVRWLCNPVEFEHRSGDAPDTIRIDHINVYGIKGIWLGDDIVAVLPRSTSAYRLPLGFHRWSKNFRIVGQRLVKEGFEQYEANNYAQQQKDYFSGIAFQEVYFHVHHVIKIDAGDWLVDANY